jgi:hypothetical protein
MAQRQPDRAVEEQVLLQANQRQELAVLAAAVMVVEVQPDQRQQLTRAQVVVEVVVNPELLTLAAVMVVLE